MLFSSLPFLFYFLPCTLGLYFLVPRRLKNAALLLCSLVFYAWGEPRFVGFMAAAILQGYAAARLMERYPTRRRLLLTLSAVLSLGMLAYCKYADFLISGFNAVTGLSVPLLRMALPIGISFYTFQILSYVIDVYRGDFPAERDPIAFALYVTYFPQLVAGPIENPADLLPQLKKEHFWNKSDFFAGVRIALCGFFRKCVVADVVGVYVSRVFAGADSANALAIFLAGALFCIQMYCDFAGYSEIAAGCARMMGVRLMRNFDRPYLSKSYTEFFRRWHISLNRWFTSYVYIPLGGNRKGKARKYLNTILVFALCGLWHGANWTYVLWGLYAAFWLCVESALDIRHRFGPKWACPAGRLVRRCVTFLIFIPAAILFRATDVAQAGNMLLGMFTRMTFTAQGVNSAFALMDMDAVGFLRVTFSIVCMAKIYRLTEYDLTASSEETAVAQRTVSYAYLILLIAVCWVALLATGEAAGFAYFQF